MLVADLLGGFAALYTLVVEEGGEDALVALLVGGGAGLAACLGICAAVVAQEAVEVTLAVVLGGLADEGAGFGLVTFPSEELTASLEDFQIMLLLKIFLHFLIILESV